MGPATQGEKSFPNSLGFNARRLGLRWHPGPLGLPELSELTGKGGFSQFRYFS